MRDTGSVPKEAAEVLKRTSTGMVIDALALVGVNGGIRGVPGPPAEVKTPGFWGGPLRSFSARRVPTVPI
ncbi:MAG: hypothetical protein KJ649_12800 [Proteobacteria bacterium]|nr:hypothetical protein [Pseudomonadota bacterium]